MPLRILVVEDDTMLGFLLSETLGEMGHEVSAVATTETDAVAAANHHKPDLMIVDVHLRHGSGLSAIDRILLAGPMPHVIMSGALDAQERPGSIMLQKPFLTTDLTQAIRRALS